MSFFKNKLAVTILALSISFVALIGYSVGRDKVSFMENGAGTAINLIQGPVYKFNSSAKGFITFIFSFSDVKKQNEELKKSNAQLKDKALAYDSLKKENERLRKDLNFKNSMSEYNYIGCDIMGKVGGDWIDAFIINRGSKDGISNGMVVVTPDGLVGKITSTASTWSQVETIANENVQVGIIVQNTSDNGIIKGYKDSDNRLLAKTYYLPLNSAVKPGNVILTSGLDQKYPKNIKIGTITEVEEDKGKVMKTAVVQPYVDFNKLEDVMVVVPKNKNEIKY